MSRTQDDQFRNLDRKTKLLSLLLLAVPKVFKNSLSMDYRPVTPTRVSPTGFQREVLEKCPRQQSEKLGHQIEI